MAYNPTTWGSNDVITKDKLNKIEQGINTASKLSGTDIDTDKDWNGKKITNVVLFVQEGVVVASDDVLKSISKGIPFVVPRGWRGAIRVKYSHYTGAETPLTTEVRLNGALIAADTITTRNTTRDISVDLPRVVEGDVVKITGDGWLLGGSATICGKTSISSRQIGGSPAPWA